MGAVATTEAMSKSLAEAIKETEVGKKISTKANEPTSGTQLGKQRHHHE